MRNKESVGTESYHVFRDEIPLKIEKAHTNAAFVWASWRKRWDSNPRYLAVHLISRPCEINPLLTVCDHQKPLSGIALNAHNTRVFALSYRKNPRRYTGRGFFGSIARF